jgi:hypothetical protein
LSSISLSLSLSLSLIVVCLPIWAVKVETEANH